MAKNAEKETALYEAVFRLLARGEKMYSVTVQQIAEEAGIGKGTVYEYFTSREEIISKAMAYRLRGEADALSERVDKAEGFEQKLDTLLCFARDSVQAQASGMKVLFASARTLESPEAVCRHIGDAPVSYTHLGFASLRKKISTMMASRPPHSRLERTLPTTMSM